MEASSSFMGFFRRCFRCNWWGAEDSDVNEEAIQLIPDTPVSEEPSASSSICDFIGRAPNTNKFEAFCSETVLDTSLSSEPDDYVSDSSSSE